MIDAWVPIAGYEGLYLISDAGEVRSVRTGKTRKQFPNRDGYMNIGLSKDGAGKTHLVHRLCLISFTGTDHPEMDVCHLNHNPADNRLANLCWATRSDNVMQSVTDGRWGKLRGECNPASKLTASDVLAIRAAPNGGPGLAARFGISASTVWKIRTRKTWKHLQGEAA